MSYRKYVHENSSGDIHINGSLCCSNRLSLVYTSIPWMLITQETRMDMVASFSW